MKEKSYKFSLKTLRGKNHVVFIDQFDNPLGILFWKKYKDGRLDFHTTGEVHSFWTGKSIEQALRNYRERIVQSHVSYFEQRIINAKVELRNARKSRLDAGL